MWREVYRLATDPEAFLDDGNIRSGLVAGGFAEPRQFAGDCFSLASEIASWRKERLLVWRKLGEEANRTGGGTAFATAVLAQSVPLASVLGAWLHGMSAPGVFEDEVHLRLMALFASDVGVGRPEASRYDRFKGLLREAALGDLALEPFELSTVATIEDDAFRLPALLLAISRRADAFGPELVAIDLAFRSLGIAPCWGSLDGVPPHKFDMRALDLSEPLGRADGSDLLAQSRWVVECYMAYDATAPARIVQMLGWVLDALQVWDAFLQCEALRAASPRLAMERLMQQRAREAMVYHQHYKLAGRTLSDWFKDAQTDPQPLIDMLAKSHLVVPGHADRSPLVTTLVGPGGRMFRVFSEADLAILCRWINTLNDNLDELPVKAVAVSTTRRTTSRAKPEPVLSLTTASDEMGHAPSSLRELYFVLQGRALAPRTRRIAERYARDWLSRAAGSLRRSKRGPPETWQPGRLRAWLLDQHDRHGLEFERSNPSDMPSREEVIDSALQLAPLTLIDGSWLQGFSDWRLAASQVGFALFQTYWDELGNGCHSLNHPKIYRDGLREMGIELSPTGSRAFAQDARFRDESFRLPVYWLSLGKLPCTFLPEILGVNLAMELSGVGGSYRSARRFLRHYGFSTEFVDIHNTIDNVSTGHSAWAVDAIDAWMRQFAASDLAAIADNWARIRIGYESLAPLPGRRERLLSMVSLRPWTRVAQTVRNASPESELFHHDPVPIGMRETPTRRPAQSDALRPSTSP